MSVTDTEQMQKVNKHMDRQVDAQTDIIQQPVFQWAYKS